MAFKKVTKEFCITDDSVNVYGYRLLTSGLMLDKFKPSIGFFMHEREHGVAVKWSNFRTDADKVYATASINMAAFPELATEIEDGFYAAASVGSIVAIEISNDESLKLEGQTGPTITKWFPREVSIVDIPGNYNATVDEGQESLALDSTFVAFDGLSKLYDNNGNVIFDLAAFNANTQNNNFKQNTNKNQTKMEGTIKLADLKLPGISSDMSVTQVNALVESLMARAGKAEEVDKELSALKAQISDSKVSDILERGMKEAKITKELADKLSVDYKGNPEPLKALIDAMPVQVRVTGAELGDFKNVPEKYIGKSYNDLYLSGELEEVQKNYPEYYTQLKKA